MAVSEICRDGVRVRLITEDDRLYVQVTGETDSEDLKSGRMSADPDVLCAVLRGMTYQLASATAYCAISRFGDTITVDFQAGGVKHICRISAEEFSRLISPVMPMRLRAMLL